MNAMQIISALDISGLKIVWLYITDKIALLDYLIDVSNTAVNMLLRANMDTVQFIRETLFDLSKMLQKYQRFVPASWVSFFEPLNKIMMRLVDITEDATIDTAEMTQLVYDFRDAYAQWKADDLPAED